MFRKKEIFRLRHLLSAFTVLSLLACAVPKHSFDQGMQAYEQENYEAAFQEWRPLAEQGHAEAQIQTRVHVLPR